MKNEDPLKTRVSRAMEDIEALMSKDPDLDDRANYAKGDFILKSLEVYVFDLLSDSIHDFAKKKMNELSTDDSRSSPSQVVLTVIGAFFKAATERLYFTYLNALDVDKVVCKDCLSDIEEQKALRMATANRIHEILHKIMSAADAAVDKSQSNEKTKLN